MTNRTDYLMDRILCIEQKQLEHEKFFARLFSDYELAKDPTQKLFFNGQVYSAYSFIVDLIKSAKEDIVLIDSYVSKDTLDLLAHKRPGVKVKIFTRHAHYESGLVQLDIEKFNTEHPHLEVIYTRDFHDRFLILDRKNAYHIGASLKDAGKRCFAITQLEDESSVQSLVACVGMPYNVSKMSGGFIAPKFSYESFRSELASFAEDEYRAFAMQGIPCDRPFLGVRIPKIRELVRKLPKDSLSDFLAESPVAIEEVLARGMAISRLPYDEMLSAFDTQLPFLDNWCSVDTFCSGLRRAIKGHESAFYDAKLQKLLESEQEFAVRTGIVLLLDYYVTFEYLSVIFGHITELEDREEYYIKTAIAWLLAECYIKFPDATRAFLDTTTLPKWTYNRAISKICDSYRVPREVKDELRSLRKK